MKKQIKVGIYCRLSVEDVSKHTSASRHLPVEESVSIENQRKLLSEFALLNGWTETKTYVDDGYSGGNFRRPGFTKLLEDVQQGHINLILVKDLSRLGRDFVEVGRYTDVVFPALGCRFVSLLDGLDTGGDNTDMLYFRSLMNDYHLKDLSGKIKTVLYSKKQKGQYISAFAPYGYKKSSEDRYKLEVDECAAEVVRRIFAMRRRGMAYGKIAAALNESGILPPRSYRLAAEHAENPDCPEECRDSQLWQYATVKKILQNEVYLGTLRCNYTGTRTYKDKTMIAKPEKEWFYHRNAHEALITREEWEQVQILNRNAGCRSADRNLPGRGIFSGKLICGGCNTTLLMNTETRRRKNGSISRYVSYSCGRYAATGHSVCSPHRIYEQTLRQLAAAEIAAGVRTITLDEEALKDKLKRSMEEYDRHRQTGIRQETGRLCRRLEELANMTAALYEDKVGGRISENTFMMRSSRIEEERLVREGCLERILSDDDNSKTNDKEKSSDIQKQAEILGKYLHGEDVNYEVINELIDELIDRLIDHIEVGECFVTGEPAEESVKESAGEPAKRQRIREIKIFFRFAAFPNNTCSLTRYGKV